MNMGKATIATKPAKAPVLIDPPSELRIAAIDVGSNSIHMVIAQIDADGGVTTLWRMKEMVGLGRLSFPSRRLSKESMDRATGALGRFQETARSRGCEKILAVATSAVREAINGGDFLVRVRRELGLLLRVVSAREEARLIYLGVRHAVELGNQPHFIMDVGGGSVEFIVADSAKPLLLESRKLGAARMTARHISSDPVSAEDLKSLTNQYDRELRPLCESILALKPVNAIATSGTNENLAAMCAQFYVRDSKRDPSIIEKEPLSRLVAALLESRSKDRAAMNGLDDQRKDQIVAGALLVNEVLRRLGLTEMKLCKSALREGILVDYLTRHLPDLSIRREVPDPRRRSVLDLGRRSQWHQAHSEQVARICLELFDQLQPIHRLGADARELIEYGCLLHDIGWHIARQGHHKHSMYLILNGDLKDFTRGEIRIIGNIARYHRKSPPTKKHAEFAKLPERAQRIVEIGAALLRVADGLDRSHGGVVSSVKCKITRKRLEIAVNSKSDAELEIWGGRNKAPLLAKLLGKSITFHQSGT
jgi:exopolyphosphatase/guanosine-5'-triphosphate,3'-diphosphate pyrophosphatase